MQDVHDEAVGGEPAEERVAEVHGPKVKLLPCLPLPAFPKPCWLLIGVDVLVAARTGEGHCTWDMGHVCLPVCVSVGDGVWVVCIICSL